MNQDHAARLLVDADFVGWVSPQGVTQQCK